MAGEVPELIRVELLTQTVQRVEQDAKEFEAKLERKFDEYVLNLVFTNYKEYMDQRIRPLERLVYGMVGLVLMSVVGGLLSLVLATK